MVGPRTPLVVAYPVPRLVVYFTESAKYASSAVTRLRRSDFIEAMYAFSFVFANFGIAIAARMPMMTTTISSSISVKPLRFILTSPLPGGRRDSAGRIPGKPWRGSPIDEAHRGVSRRGDAGLTAGLACRGTCNADVGATDAERVAKNQTSVCG